MLELYKLEIKNKFDLIIFRDKILFLMKIFSNKSCLSTYLASYISNFCTKQIIEKKHIEFYLYFTKNIKNNYDFIIEVTNYDFYKLEISSFFSLYKNILKIITKDKKVFFKLDIQNSKIKINNQYIKDLKEKLITNSKSSMFVELEKKNKDLQIFIEKIKTSGETLQAEKMKSLGSMTAGVAHELNNPMMGILNFIQYGLKHIDKENKSYKTLMFAEKEIIRCQEIISNLLTFSRLKQEGEDKNEKIKFSTLIMRNIKLYNYRINKENIKLIYNFEYNKDSYVFCKINKVQQVILNLIINALDAMENSKLKNLTFDIKEDKNNSTLIIEDTGYGIDEKIKDKVFDPFFTTKDVGKGTGLGLSIAYTIINKNNGNLNFTSIINKGTKFFITLPKYEEEYK